MQHRKSGITTLPTSTHHHHLYPICLQLVMFLIREHTSGVTFSTVLSVLVESQENPSPTTLSRTLPSKTLNLALRIDRIILQLSIGSWADLNSVRPATRPIGRYSGRVSGWDYCHPLRIGLSPGGLRWRQNPTQVQPFKVGRVVGSPDVTGEVLISLR
jgi:hypothetical protein